MYLRKLSLAPSRNSHLPSVGWGQEEIIRMLGLDYISVSTVVSQSEKETAGLIIHQCLFDGLLSSMRIFGNT